jgi:hypothetical protein
MRIGLRGEIHGSIQGCRRTITSKYSDKRRNTHVWLGCLGSSESLGNQSSGKLDNEDGILTTKLVAGKNSPLTI